MADLNALIAQGYQFQAPPDPFVQYAKRQQLDQGEQTNQLNQMKMQEYQRGIQEQNALRGLDPSSPTYLQNVMKINPKLGFEFAKSQQEAKTASTEGKIKDTELLTKKLSLLPGMYASADTPDKYIALHESIHADPILGNYLNSIGATKQQGRAKIDEAIANGTFDDLRIGSMQKVEDVAAHLADVAYGQSKNTPAPGAAPMGAPKYDAAPLVPMPNEPMVAPAVTGLNADQARAQLAVAPNALASQVAPVNALAAAPTVDRVKQIDDRLLEGNTSKYKNSTGWKDEKKILETERTELVKVQPDIALMRALNLPNTPAGFTTLQALKNSSPSEFERAIKAANLNPAEIIAVNRAYLKQKTTNPPGTNVNVNTFTPASVEAQKQFVQTATDERKVLRNAPDTLKNLEAAKKLIPTASTFMGKGGEPLLAAASFLNNRLGFGISTQGVTDATVLRTRLFEGILDNLKKLDSQPSQEQQRVLAEALGNLGTDPAALEQILNRIGETVRDRVDRFNTDVTEAETRGVKFPFKPQITLPSFTPPPPSGASLIPGSTPAAGAFKYLGKESSK